MGLYESGDVYSQADLNSFFAEYAPYVPQDTHPLLDSIDGGEAPVDPGSQYNTGESDIDMDIAFSLIYVSLRYSIPKEEMETDYSRSHKLSRSTKWTTKLSLLRTADSTLSWTLLMALIVPTLLMASQATVLE